jgi:hypothetical protein
MKMVLHVTIAMPSANVDLLVWKPLTFFFSTGTRIKNCGNIKPDNAFGKTGYKWKAWDNWNSRLERGSCIN